MGKIAGLENNFTIKNGRNRLTYQFQTGVEMKAPAATTSQSVTFACGIFRNNKLVAVRPDKLLPTTIPRKEVFRIISFTLNYTEQNVPVGTRKLRLPAEKLNLQISILSLPSEKISRIQIQFPMHSILNLILKWILLNM
jgi:hypothetical protein